MVVHTYETFPGQDVFLIPQYESRARSLPLVAFPLCCAPSILSLAKGGDRLPDMELSSSATPPAPVTWPAGIKAAACLTFDMDAESAVLSADLSSAGRMSPMSHQAYGPLVGVPRILGLLSRNDIRATFFVPGYSAHRYPDIVRAIAEAGHEIAHHSYFHENTIGMDAATEAAMLDLGLQALQDVAGVRPAGYRAPLWEMNYHTPGLLADRGFRYDSSLMDSDHPYVLAADDEPGGRSLVEVPSHGDLTTGS